MVYVWFDVNKDSFWALYYKTVGFFFALHFDWSIQAIIWIQKSFSIYLNIFFSSISGAHNYYVYRCNVKYVMAIIISKWMWKRCEKKGKLNTHQHNEKIINHMTRCVCCCFAFLFSLLFHIALVALISILNISHQMNFIHIITFKSTLITYVISKNFNVPSSTQRVKWFLFFHQFLLRRN